MRRQTVLGYPVLRARTRTPEGGILVAGTNAITVNPGRARFFAMLLHMSRFVKTTLFYFANR